MGSNVLVRRIIVFLKMFVSFALQGLFVLEKKNKTPTIRISLKDPGDPLKIKTKIKISGIDYR